MNLRNTRRAGAAAGAFVLVLAIGVGTAAAAGPRAGAGRGGVGGAVCPVPNPVTATVSLTAAQASALAGMAEEEKLARDLYAAFAARYPTRVWSSIGAAESTHLAAIRTLLSRYGVADPTAGKAAGTFATPAVQALYAKLLAAGNATEAAAFGVGRTVELDDISKLDAALVGVTATDVRQVYANLRRGSIQHLAAFNRLLGPIEPPPRPASQPSSARPVVTITGAHPMSTLAAPRPRGTFGAIRRPRRGLRSLHGVQGFRRATQTAIALAVLAVALVRAFSVTGGGPGGATTPEALCPFGGIETIGTFIAHGWIRRPRPHREPGPRSRAAPGRVLRARCLLRLDLPPGLPPGPDIRLRSAREEARGARPACRPRARDPGEGPSPARPPAAPPQVRRARLGRARRRALRRDGVPRRRPVDRPARRRPRERGLRPAGSPGPARRLVLRRPALVPLCLSAGRRQRHRGPPEPGLPPARHRSLCRLQRLQPRLPDGPARRDGDEGSRRPTASDASSASRPARAPARSS